MIKLIKKEFMLALHPTAVIFLAFATFVFIPNYPYEVMFFFSGLSTFFVCLTARENNDLLFTCILPIKKENSAKARILTTAIFQVTLLCLAAAFALLKSVLLPAPNEAGMDTNASFVGMGAVILGAFNIIFFPQYYKNPNKVGFPFLVSSIVTFIIITIEILLCYAVPFIRDCIDTLDPTYVWYRVATLILGVFIYIVLTISACRISARNLKSVDL